MDQYDSKGYAYDERNLKIFMVPIKDTVAILPFLAGLSLKIPSYSRVNLVSVLRKGPSNKIKDRGAT